MGLGPQPVLFDAEATCGESAAGFGGLRPPKDGEAESVSVGTSERKGAKVWGSPLGVRRFGAAGGQRILGAGVLGVSAGFVRGFWGSGGSGGSRVSWLPSFSSSSFGSFLLAAMILEPPGAS